MTTEPWYAVLVGVVTLERLAELVIAKRNLAWSLRRGGRESARGHYPLMVVLHTALLAGSVLEASLADRPFLPTLGWPMFGLVIAAQALRWWCIATLGHRWNTRVVVVPGLAQVTHGPYRWFAHPNYLAVVVEGVALPLTHTATLTATLFTVLNAGLLRVRIRAENDALTTIADDDRAVQTALP